MKRTLEETWQEVSHHLDQVLELEGPARETWLRELAAREPQAAAKVRACLAGIAQLNAQNFLAIPPDGMLAGATLAGQRVGAYTLDRLIGHGGTGTVWLAHRSDGRFEGQAAVKLLNTSLVGHPSEARFAREGSVLARLQHPNIAHLLDAGVVAASQPYLVLEYVLGERIDRYCELKQLNIEQRIRLFLDVLAAVAHAHTKLIVHRDLKPSNILVTGHGMVKLLDFGIAALLSAEDLAQLTSQVPPGLTPAYAAPEQLLGEPVTTATDVYALGLVLFVLLAGRHPASPEGKTPAELMSLTLDTEPPRASETTTNVRHVRLLRGDLDNIIAKALRKNPAERYATVADFAQDLQRYLALQPVSARPSSLGYRTARFVRRHLGAIVSAVAVTAVLIGAVIVTTREMVEAQRQRDESRYQSRRAESSGDFLKLLMLSDGGPARPALTVGERLELGVELLNKQYRDDPKFAGRMLVELAAFFRDNHETRRADELYEQAYAMGQKIGDKELMAYALCDRAYGDAYADIREGVIERIAEGRKLIEESPDIDPTLTANCLMAQARFDAGQGATDKAEADLRYAMRLVEQHGSTHRQIYVSLLTEVGSIYLSRNEPAEVLKIATRVGEIHERNGRGGTAARLLTRQNAAVALAAMGEARAALAERTIINERARELETPGQEPFAYPVNHATLLVRMGKPEEALQALEGVLERARRSGNMAALAQTLLVRGWALVELQRWDEAAAMLNEGAAVAADGIGNRNASAQFEVLLARLDFAHGNTQGAARHRDQALQLAGYRTDRPGRPLARVLTTASNLALGQGAPADAERFASDALAVSERVARGPETSADVGEALLRLAQARIANGAPNDAQPLLERAVKCLTNGLEADHPLTIEARNALAN